MNEGMEQCRLVLRCFHTCTAERCDQPAYICANVQRAGEGRGQSLSHLALPRAELSGPGQVTAQRLTDPRQETERQRKHSSEPREPAAGGRGGTSAPFRKAFRREAEARLRSGSEPERPGRLCPQWMLVGPAAAPRRGTGRPGRDRRVGPPHAGGGRSGTPGLREGTMIGGRGPGRARRAAVRG